MPSDPGDALQALQDRYRELLERLEGSQAHFHRLARSVFRVQEEERRRLARDLHDGIGQNLTALKHQLAQLEPDLPGHARARLHSVMELCSQTLEDTRQMSRLLRPQVLDDLGLEAGLRWLTRTLSEGSGVNIEMEVEPLPQLDGDEQTLLFRVAQEALTNVVRHSGGTQALLRLVFKAGWAQLTVWDDGSGCDPERILAEPGSGIGGMRERVRMHGGRLEIHSGSDGGCRLHALVPLDGNRDTVHD
jgi:signal transduction histidine kinase